MPVGVHVALTKAPKAIEGCLVGQRGLPTGDVEPCGQLQPLGQLEHGRELHLVVVSRIVLQIVEPALDRLVNDLGVLVVAWRNVGPVEAVVSGLGQPWERVLLHPGHLGVRDDVVEDADVR